MKNYNELLQWPIQRTLGVQRTLIEIFQIRHQQWVYVFIRLPKPLTARHGLSSVRNGQQKGIKNVIAEYNQCKKIIDLDINLDLTCLVLKFQSDMIYSCHHISWQITWIIQVISGEYKCMYDKYPGKKREKCVCQT